MSATKSSVTVYNPARVTHSAAGLYFPPRRETTVAATKVQIDAVRKHASLEVRKVVEPKDEKPAKAGTSGPSGQGGGQ